MLRGGQANCNQFVNVPLLFWKTFWPLFKIYMITLIIHEPYVMFGNGSICAATTQYRQDSPNEEYITPYWKMHMLFIFWGESQSQPL